MAQGRNPKEKFQVGFILAADRYQRFLLTSPSVTTEQARIRLRNISDEEGLPELLTTERYVGKFIDFPDDYRAQNVFLEELWEEIKDKL